MRDLLAVGTEVAVLEFKPFGEAGELAGGVLGDLGVGALGAEQAGTAEEGTKNGKRGQRAGRRSLVAQQVVEVERVDAFGGGGEFGVDLEGLQIRDDEQRRIAELFAIVVELEIGLMEVFMLAFVRPGEVVATPDVGKAFDAVVRGMAFSKA